MAAGTQFVHDWSSYLHTSHHTVTTTSVSVSSFLFFCILVNLLPPFSLSCVCAADEGPSTGPHGEGGLAGPADLQRDRDDQRGEKVSKVSVTDRSVTTTSVHIFTVCVFLQSEKRSSNFMYLMVEFPRVKTNDKEYSIVYYEKVLTCISNFYITRCVCVKPLEMFSAGPCAVLCLCSGWRRHIACSHQLRHCQSS